MALAIALGACRAKSPALVLDFVDLPESTGMVQVDLSADSWAFTGKDTLNSGGVSILHQQATGNLGISIDRGFLRAKHDHLRLGLTTPRSLLVTATASALADMGTLRATAMDTAMPGQDLNLRFVFTEVGRDGGASDDGGGMPSPDDGGADLTSGAGGEAGALDLAVSDGLAPPLPDGGADGPPSPDGSMPPPLDGPKPPPPDGPIMIPPDGPTAPPPDGPTVACTAGPVTPISASVPTTPPSLAVVGPSLFGAVWPDANRVLYNAVDGGGTLQHATDVIAASDPNTSTMYRTPRLAVGGGNVYLAYGRSMSGGNINVAIRILHPATGETDSGSLVLNGPGAASAPELSGLVFGMNAVELSRIAGSAPSQARLDLVTAPPLTRMYTQSDSSLAGSRAAALGWADQAKLYGAAVLVDGSERGGVMSIFGTDLTFVRSFSFTPNGAAPNFTSPGATLSVAGAGDRLAVAWIDNQRCAACTGPREVFLAVVDPMNVAPVKSVHVSDRGSPAPKLFPHVAFDGTSYAVIWEEDDGAASQVWLRRFDTDLHPIGAITEVSAGAPARPVGDIDLVADGRNGYGMVFTPTGKPHHFTRISCTGP